MADDNLILVSDSVRVPFSELTYRASRSGGPGGQHVNTSSTRVELTWEVARSASITDEERARIMERLANRIDSEGVLRLIESGSRSQSQNKARVTERFRSMLADALRVPKKRRRTRPSAAARESRLREKRRRAEIKRGRGPVDEQE